MTANILLITILTIHSGWSLRNGRRTDSTEFGYIVSVQKSDRHWCSGTIIDERYILTAGHAVAGINNCELSVVVGLGVVRYPWFRSIPVEKVHVHRRIERVAAEYWDNDVAILRLTERLVWGLNVSPVTLVDTEFDSYMCFNCIMISWHYPRENVTNMVALMVDYVKDIEDLDCHNYGIRVLTNQRCFVDIFEADFTGLEDVGSPIVCGNSMVGLIVKEGKKGVVGCPSTFLSVSPYSDFIREIINDGKTDVRVEEFPYIASLWHFNEYVCGGFIIDATLIITAAHCLRGKKKNEFKVAVGSTEVSPSDLEVQWFSIHSIRFNSLYKVIHNWLNTSTDHIVGDVAAVKLAEPILWSPTTRKIDISEIENVLTPFCTVLNWKHETDYFGNGFIKLKASIAEILDTDGRRELNVLLGRAEFSARHPYGSILTYPNDAGNPISCGGFVVGIVVKPEPIDTSLSPPATIFLRLQDYRLFLINAISRK